MRAVWFLVLVPSAMAATPLGGPLFDPAVVEDAQGEVAAPFDMVRLTFAEDATIELDLMEDPAPNVGATVTWRITDLYDHTQPTWYGGVVYAPCLSPPWQALREGPDRPTWHERAGEWRRGRSPGDIVWGEPPSLSPDAWPTGLRLDRIEAHTYDVSNCAEPRVMDGLVAPLVATTFTGYGGVRFQVDAGVGAPVDAWFGLADDVPLDHPTQQVVEDGLELAWDMPARLHGCTQEQAMLYLKDGRTTGYTMVIENESGVFRPVSWNPSVVDGGFEGESYGELELGISWEPMRRSVVVPHAWVPGGYQDVDRFSVWLACDGPDGFVGFNRDAWQEAPVSAIVVLVALVGAAWWLRKT